MVIFTKDHAYDKPFKCKALSDPCLLESGVAEAARGKMMGPIYPSPQQLLPAVPVGNQYRV